MELAQFAPVSLHLAWLTQKFLEDRRTDDVVHREVPTGRRMHVRHRVSEDIQFSHESRFRLDGNIDPVSTQHGFVVDGIHIRGSPGC
jgi:membrane protein implicated in regulation of membrane protease activity